MGYQWFSIQEWTEAAMLKGVEVVQPLVDNFLDNLLKKTGLTDDKLALVGFSQGTMTSLYVGPRRKNAIAGILGYSGALLGASELKTGLIHKIPTCLIHGDVDTVVPITEWHKAMAQLKHAGFPVEGEVVPGLAHSIDETGMATGLAFLRRILK
jgi:phospholipase/carboxylesterase